MGNGLLQAWKQAHNEYLQIWVEHGAIGLILVLGFIASLIRKAWRCRTPIMYIAFLGFLVGILNSGVNFLMHTTMGALLIVYVAIMEKEALCEDS